MFAGGGGGINVRVYFQVSIVPSCIVYIVRSESGFRGGGEEGFGPKRGTPPTLSSMALLSKKIDKNGTNWAKIVQNRKKSPKAPKICLNGLLRRFLSVFFTHKSKRG
jgi:hypothetical protein